MSGHSALLGLYVPGSGWLHRWGVGWKYALVLVLTLPPLVVGTWWATTAALVLAVLLLATAGIGPATSLRIGLLLAVLLVGVAALHLLLGRPEVAVVQSGNILVAVLGARLLTLTTSTPLLVDALVTGLRPLAFLGLDPRRTALAVALMLRSLPYLLDAVGDARDAARARGLERNPVRLMTPVVVGAVAYAERTGEALQARGLGDSPPPPEAGDPH